MKLELITCPAHAGTNRTPLLFVHGSCHAAWAWNEHFLKYFAARGYDAHAVSLRGHGESKGRERLRWTSIADYVLDVAQEAAKLPRPPVVIGHSLGGLVVQKYLETHAAPAAVLFASVPVSGMLKSGLAISLRHPLIFVEVFVRLDVHALFRTPRRARKFLFSPDMDEAKVAKYTARLGQESFRAFLEMMFNLPDVTRIKTPMLVLGAGEDAIIGTDEIKRTARAYHADVKIFSGMAHDMMLEDDWEDVARFMVEWFEARGL